MNNNKDIRLNLSKIEVLIRSGIAFSLPIILIWYRPFWLILTIAIISGYLFITSLTFYCYLKALWQPRPDKRNERNQNDSDVHKL
jgi:hypothetical protein